MHTAYDSLVQKIHERQMSRRRKENTRISMKLEEIWCGDVDRIAVAQDRIKLRDFMNTAIDLKIGQLKGDISRKSIN
jgi:hypothetical protein